MPSTELALRSDTREAYNGLYGSELKAHGDTLTAEQAEQINGHYDIELYVGVHGIIPDGRSENPYKLGRVPTQQEYDELRLLPTKLEYREAAAVVDGMQPGDTLFMEYYGFSRAQGPVLPRGPSSSSASIKEKPSSTEERLLSELVPWIGREAIGDVIYHRLEQAREERKIDIWHYARGLAFLKGIRVVYADHDAFEDTSLQALAQGRDIAELSASPNEEDRALAKRMHTRREHSACNILKDWALDHLPPQGADELRGRKPKLVMLFGGGHKEGLEQAFDNLGLDVEVSVMKSTGMQEWVAEQVARLMRDAWGEDLPFQGDSKEVSGLSMNSPMTRWRRDSVGAGRSQTRFQRFGGLKRRGDHT